MAPAAPFFLNSDHKKRAAQKDKRGQILPAAHEPPVSRWSMFMITAGSVSAGIGQAYTLSAVFSGTLLCCFFLGSVYFDLLGGVGTFFEEHFNPIPLL